MSKKSESYVEAHPDKIEEIYTALATFDAMRDRIEEVRIAVPDIVVPTWWGLSSKIVSLRDRYSTHPLAEEDTRLYWKRYNLRTARNVVKEILDGLDYTDGPLHTRRLWLSTNDASWIAWGFTLVKQADAIIKTIEEYDYEANGFVVYVPSMNGRIV